MRLSVLLNAEEILARSIRRRERSVISAALILSALLGIFVGYLISGDRAEAIRAQAAQTERTEMVRTLYRCARTHNIYHIPGTEIVVEARISKPTGLKIIDISKVRERERRANLNR